MGRKPEDYKKPPLGVMPKFFFERNRILDLTRAIHERVSEDMQDLVLLRWAHELGIRIEEYIKIKDKLE